MSFLSSVLKSITKDDSSDPASSSRFGSAIRPPASSGVTSLKRKADDEFIRPGSKASKTVDTRLERDIRPLPAKQKQAQPNSAGINPSSPAKPSIKSATNGVRPNKLAQPAASSRPAFQGTARPSNGSKLSSTAVASPKAVSGVDAKKAGQAARPSISASSNASSSSQAISQPKKGSFKALMAQAKSAPTVAVGKITHRSSEKLSKRDRLALSKGQAVRGREAPVPVAPAAGKPSVPLKDGKKKDVPAPAAKYQGTSKPKAPTKPTYQGTAKPVAKPGYKGTSKPGSTAPSQSKAKPARKEERNEYLGTDEEDEGEYGYDSEEQYYEDSDDFSDMDAGFDEIGDEEEEAERMAKREDMKEQKLLEKLAKEKEARKKGRF